MLRFSVIIPHLNSGSFLQHAVRSALDQPGVDIECIVVDGGSEDHSLSQLPKTDHRLQIIKLPNCVSPAQAINRGLGVASGSIIGILSSDDVYQTNALSAVDTFFCNNSLAKVLYGQAEYMDELGSGLKKFHVSKPTLKHLQTGSCLCSSAVFYRRELVQQFGSFDENLKYWMGYEYWIRLAKASIPFAATDRVLAGKRIHPGNRISGANREREHELQSLEEVLSMLRSQFGTVGQHWPLHLGRVAAYAGGHDRSSSLAYDIATIQRAAQESALDGETSVQRRSARLKLILRHVPTEAKQIIRRPKYLLRFLPIAKNSKTKKSLGRRIFRLRYDEPYACQLPPTYFAAPELDDPPVISIVTPNLNQGIYIERTIASVLVQDYPRLQYVVQDGSSKDESLDIIQKYDSQLASWESIQDRGQSHAINLGLRRTNGDIMAYLNSDDTLVPGSLAYVANYFQRHPQIDVIYGNRLLIDEDDRIINRWVLPAHDSKAIVWADYIPQETMFWRRRAWDAVGGQLDESFHFAMDWDLILRFRAAGLKFARLPRFLGAFRITDGQKTNQMLTSTGVREMNRLRHRELGYIPSEKEVSRKVRGYVLKQRATEKLHNIFEGISNLIYPPIEWGRKDSKPRTESESRVESGSQLGCTDPVFADHRRAA